MRGHTRTRQYLCKYSSRIIIEHFRGAPQPIIESKTYTHFAFDVTFVLGQSFFRFVFSLQSLALSDEVRTTNDINRKYDNMQHIDSVQIKRYSSKTFANVAVCVCVCWLKVNEHESSLSPDYTLAAGFTVAKMQNNNLFFND